MMAQNEGPVLQFRLRCRVCVQSLCGGFFLQRKPPFKTLEYHLLVPHTPGLVRSQLCSAAQQLGQQLTHVAASPSYISAFRKQLSNISFFLCSLMSHIWPKSLKIWHTPMPGGHQLMILIQCTAIYVNFGHLGVKQSWKVDFSCGLKLPLLWANKLNMKNANTASKTLHHLTWRIFLC